MGKTHPDTLVTITNMAGVYADGLKDYTKAEEMLTLALDGNEKSLGMDHESTKKRARNLGVLLAQPLSDRRKTRELVNDYLHLLT